MPKRLLIIFTLVLVLLGVGFLWMFGSDDKQQAAYYSDNWKDQFGLQDSTPRGLTIFKELLEYHTRSNSRTIYDSLRTKKPDESALYVFTGDEFYLKQHEFYTLIREVKKGSTLFISYNSLSDDIYSEFFNPSQMKWRFSQHLDVAFNRHSKSYRLSSVYEQDTLAIKWRFFMVDSLRFDNVMGYDQVNYVSNAYGYVNFMQMKVGKGQILLHSTPETFLNYQLLSNNGYDHCNRVMQHLPDSLPLCFLELGRVGRYQIIEQNNESSSNGNRNGQGGGQEDNSLLKYIFRHKELLAALLFALLGVILYLIFRTKRNQPIVPYLARSANHSLSFADTLKEIYFRKQTPIAILQVMRRNFYTAVNKQFFVDINKKERARELQTLTEKSGISKDELEKILRQFEINSALLVDYPYLQKTAEIQRDFYRRTGIVKEKMEARITRKTIRIERGFWTAFALIFSGIIISLISFYLLFDKQGAAILLWPVSIVLLAIGIRWLSVPLMKITATELVFYRLFGKKLRYKREDLERIAVQNGISQFLFAEGREQQIRHQDISAFSRNAFEQFVSTYVNDSL